MNKEADTSRPAPPVTKKTRKKGSRNPENSSNKENGTSNNETIETTLSAENRGPNMSVAKRGRRTPNTDRRATLSSSNVATNNITPPTTGRTGAHADGYDSPTDTAAPDDHAAVGPEVDDVAPIPESDPKDSCGQVGDGASAGARNDNEDEVRDIHEDEEEDTDAEEEESFVVPSRKEADAYQEMIRQNIAKNRDLLNDMVLPARNNLAQLFETTTTETPAKSKAARKPRSKKTAPAPRRRSRRLGGDDK